ncbi:DUF3618 domain-containing protein [uncultured Jannaschia sp.]|uniref:DUF3618 domain-containing protein n=1 Tax=uncultured Jannaschia sp. TaxID=293347 RepID=UPI0026225A47|nr:DUF3618 domain-containing protein [uncultured Jannaschia sp.]
MADSNHDQKSAREAERDVEAARASLAGSIDNLEARLSPNALVEQGIAYLQGDGRRHIDKLARNAQANPIPLVLIGIGVAWLALGSNRNPGPRRIGRRVPEHRGYGRDDYAPASNATPSSSGFGSGRTGATDPRDELRTTGLATAASPSPSDKPDDARRSPGVAAGTDPAISDDARPKDAATGNPVIGSKPNLQASTGDGEDTPAFRDPIATAHSERDEDKNT